VGGWVCVAAADAGGVRGVVVACRGGQAPRCGRLSSRHPINICSVQKTPTTVELSGAGESLDADTKCAAGCTVHGSCNEDLGRCDCPYGYAGDDCSVNQLPACTLDVGYTLPCGGWVRGGATSSAVFFSPSSGALSPLVVSIPRLLQHPGPFHPVDVARSLPQATFNCPPGAPASHLAACPFLQLLLPCECADQCASIGMPVAQCLLRDEAATVELDATPLLQRMWRRSLVHHPKKNPFSDAAQAEYSGFGVPLDRCAALDHCSYHGQCQVRYAGEGTQL
jgi:hypothetical protein